MITIGIDPHKRTHTAVAVDEVGRRLGELTVTADEEGQRRLLAWTDELDGEPRFALEDCRHVNGRLERFLLAAGADVLRVPPRLMAGARKSTRERGKSDPIDALAIARAALREEGGLHPAGHDPAARELKLLVDYREGLVRERTVLASRLRWQLHDLAPDLEPVARSLDQASTRRSLCQRLARREQDARVRICRDLLARIGELTRRERELAAEIGRLAREYAPELLEIPGVARLTAGKLIGEIAGAGRFRSDAALAQARVHPGARAYLARKRAEGKSSAEALRCLKRLLVRSVWKTLRPYGGQPVSLPKSQFVEGVH